MMNMEAIFKLKQAWNTFSRNHPRFPDFLQAAKNKGISEGTDIEITIRYPDGSDLKAGIRVKQSDLELLQTLQSLAK